MFRGKVVEVAPQTFPVHKDLKWVDITSVSPKPKVGWSHDGVNCVAPPTPTAGDILVQKDARKERQLNAPAIKALLKVLADRFSIDIAVLRQQVKDGMETQ
ncbi:MAG: hypothetical protein GY800_08210 [Planctomycetes bacterium]|nr:hypothetical protein [Planctomycetota bacterium]